MWSDTRLLDLLGIEHPILLAPMAGAADVDLAVAVARAGGLGALPTAVLTPEQVEAHVAALRAQTNAAFNLNFFCHKPPAADKDREARWRAALAPLAGEYSVELGDPSRAARAPFNEDYCAVVERVRPPVVSFHFGLPAPDLLARVKATGARVLGCATSVEEARWLEARGCDAIIAQGAEGGGHRGMFLSEDIATQTGTMALVPQVVDAVKVPVIATGAIADGRGMAAALCLGAAAVQIGTAFLKCPEAKPNPMLRAALAHAGASSTVITNVLTGRPARGILNRVMREVGPMNDNAPAFPGAASSLAPLRAAAEARGADDFSNLWSGQAAALSREEPAREKVKRICTEAAAILQFR